MANTTFEGAELRSPRTSRRILFAAIGTVSLILGVAAPASAAGHPGSSTIYSVDGQWRLRVEASASNALLYKSMGVSATTQHREWSCSGPCWWTGHTWRWVTRPVDSIGITVRFTRGGVTQSDKTCQIQGRSALDCKIYGFLAGVSQVRTQGVNGEASATFPAGHGYVTTPVVEDESWF